VSDTNKPVTGVSPCYLWRWLSPPRRPQFPISTPEAWCVLNYNLVSPDQLLVKSPRCEE